MVYVNVEEFTKAIEERTGMDTEKSRNLASHFMGYFGHSEVVLDHYFEPDYSPDGDRGSLYTLEEAGLVKSQRKDGLVPVFPWQGNSKKKSNKYTIKEKYTTKEWRTFEWELRTDVIKQIANNGKGLKPGEVAAEGDIYSSLPGEAWERHVPNKNSPQSSETLGARIIAIEA